MSRGSIGGAPVVGGKVIGGAMVGNIVPVLHSKYDIFWFVEPPHVYRTGKWIMFLKIRWQYLIL